MNEHIDDDEITSTEVIASGDYLTKLDSIESENEEEENQSLISDENNDTDESNEKLLDNNKTPCHTSSPASSSSSSSSFLSISTKTNQQKENKNLIKHSIESILGLNSKQQANKRSKFF